MEQTRTWMRQMMWVCPTHTGSREETTEGPLTQRMRTCREYPPHAQCTPSRANDRSPRRVTSVSSGLYKDEDVKTYLLDVRDLRREPLRDLRDDLLNERLVLHRLSRLHDTEEDKADCQKAVRARGQNETHRTMVAWMTYLRSSSTVLSTSVDSAFCSALMGVFKLIRIFLDLKSVSLRQ